MNTLITGANGYIGGYLHKEMKARGLSYICSSRNDFDYTDINSIRSFFKGKNIDTVIHLAGVVDNKDSADLFDINLMGLYDLLRVCEEFKVKRIVFASTNNVYGTVQKTLLKETDVVMPDYANKYGFSKYMGELLVKDFCSSVGMSFANVRIADVYGPEQKHGNLLRAIANNAKEGKPLALYGEGVRTRDYTYVKDVAAGLAFLAQSDFCGEINLGTGIGTSVKQMLDIVNKICDNKLEIKKVSVDQEDSSCVVLNIDRLNSLGFMAKYSVENGMTEIIKGE